MIGSTTLLTGYVVDNDDPEHLGRVRVSFILPGEDRGKSEWARVALPYASKNGGFHFIPNMGDEVLIAFIMRDSGHPIVIGSLYNEEHLPPDYPYDDKHNRDKKNTLRSIKTESGMELTIRENQDDSFLKLYDGKRMELTIDRTKESVTVGDAKGSRVEIDSKNGRLEITDASGNRIVIQDGKIELEASSRITFGAGGSHAVPLGDLLMQLFNSHIHNTGVGPSSVPTTPMTEQHLSQLSFTK